MPNHFGLKCGACGGTQITKSVPVRSGSNVPPYLSCKACGESEDSRDGILDKEGKKTTYFKVYKNENKGRRWDNK